MSRRTRLWLVVGAGVLLVSLWRAASQPSDYGRDAGSTADFASTMPALRQSHRALQAGVERFRTGRYDEAVSQFRLARERLPAGAPLAARARALYNEGTALIRAGRYRLAIERFDRLLAAVPDHADGAFNRSVASALLGGEAPGGLDARQPDIDSVQRDRPFSAEGFDKDPPAPVAGETRRDAVMPVPAADAGARAEARARELRDAVASRANDVPRAAGRQGARRADRTEADQATRARDAERVRAGEGETAAASHSGSNPGGQTPRRTAAGDDARRDSMPAASDRASDRASRGPSDGEGRGGRDLAAYDAAAAGTDDIGAPPVRATLETQRVRERRQAVEQWLRRIPDTPGALLRRKLEQRHQRDYPGVTDGIEP